MGPIIFSILVWNWDRVLYLMFSSEIIEKKINIIKSNMHVTTWDAWTTYVIIPPVIIALFWPLLTELIEMGQEMLVSTPRSNRIKRNNKRMINELIGQRDLIKEKRENRLEEEGVKTIEDLNSTIKELEKKISGEANLHKQLNAAEKEEVRVKNDLIKNKQAYDIFKNNIIIEKTSLENALINTTEKNKRLRKKIRIMLSENKIKQNINYIAKGDIIPVIDEYQTNLSTIIRTGTDAIENINKMVGNELDQEFMKLVTEPNTEDELTNDEFTKFSK